MLPRMLLSDPSEWSLDEVRALISGQVPEGQRLDYKRELHLDNKAQKAEVAKDISGMANAQGGWIVFGVSEDESPEPLPSEITPVPADGIQTRLENILDSALEPVPKYRIATIAAGDGVVLAVKVSKARGRPVMVQGYGQHRYFVRSGTRTRPMDAGEVGRAHSLAELQASRVLDRLHDLPLISNVAQHMLVPTMDDMVAMPVVCVLVAAIDGPPEVIARTMITQHAFAESGEGYLGKGQVRGGAPWTINKFGLVEGQREAPPQPQGRLVAGYREVAEDDDRLKTHRVAVYRAGVVEWAHRYSGGQVLPSRSLAHDVHDALLYAARVLDEASYVGQVASWVQIEHAEQAELGVAAGLDIAPQRPGVDEIGTSEELENDELLHDPTPVVRRAMDAIWQGFGLERCHLFDADGKWIE
ncbi:MAG TPA: ATP-binding protein [Solirubrobacterales bacterium]